MSSPQPWVIESPRKTTAFWSACVLVAHRLRRSFQRFRNQSARRIGPMPAKPSSVAGIANESSDRWAQSASGPANPRREKEIPITTQRRDMSGFMHYTLNEKCYRCKDAKGKSKRGKKETQRRKGARTQRGRKEKKRKELEKKKKKKNWEGDVQRGRKPRA